MRSKLKLNLEQLAVDSFDTSAPKAEKGTVFGEQIAFATRPGDHTCQWSCDGSCDTGPCMSYCASCDNTCEGATCDGRWSDCTCGYICGYTANFTNCNEICI
ncbi:MAG TPA: hypothetical protein VGB15_11635 [Longimicrobium sp.]|jgi:hypothetical protein